MIKEIKLGVAFPACDLQKRLIKQANKKLSDYNITLVTVNNSTGKERAPFKNTPINGVKELYELFSRDDINAIICARGGFGTQHLMDHFNCDIIKKNPKIFIGYSDITILLNKISKDTGLITYHGAMLQEIATIDDDKFFKKFRNLLKGKLFGLTLTGGLKETKTINTGTAEGKLIGGNLTSICATINTNAEIEFDNNILFIEDLEEDLYQIDRLLTILNQTGKIKRTAGIIVGDFIKISNNRKIKYKISLESLLKERLKNYHGPIICNYPAGHKNYCNFLPIGQFCRLVANHNENIVHFCH